MVKEKGGRDTVRVPLPAGQGTEESCGEIKVVFDGGLPASLLGSAPEASGSASVHTLTGTEAEGVKPTTVTDTDVGDAEATELTSCTTSVLPSSESCEEVESHGDALVTFTVSALGCHVSVIIFFTYPGG